MLLTKMTAVIICAFLSSFFSIKIFLKITDRKKIFYQPIREDGPKSHLQSKKNTPTMGGLMIIFASFFSTILFSDLKNNYIAITLFVFISFAAIGFIDDFLKIRGKNSKGFRGSIKLIIEFTIVSAALLLLEATNNIYLQGFVSLPFTSFSFNLGIIYIPFAALVIVGAANAFNLTDGLDGLATVPAIFNFICLAIMIYVISNDSSELIIFCLSLIGALLAFLFFNLKPAKIFMGDVGSLGIGAALGVIAIIIKQELVFAIIALLFVLEALSVIIQVTSYKLRKKRIFLMAPLHHHFEKLGWSEKQVVTRFWLASFIFSAIGLTGFFL